MERKFLRGFERGIQASVYLVGGDVYETSDAVAPRRFQQCERTSKIRLEDGSRRKNAAVHVRFGGEMDNGIDPLLAQDPVHDVRVADIALHEAVMRVRLHARQIF